MKKSENGIAFQDWAQFLSGLHAVAHADSLEKLKTAITKLKGIKFRNIYY